MLVSSKELLENAKRFKQGIAAPDFIDLDTARTFCETAERLNQPIILSYAQSHSHLLSLEEAAAIGKVVASSVNVPIALHLDHGQDLKTIKKAIELGFTSVMIDASVLPLEENIALTKKVIALARPKKIPVEAEIGHVGQNETEGVSEGDVAESIYTSLEEAIYFYQETNVDTLAVSIGTAHGFYKATPKLNFERLKEISEALNIPLVLHGSSGTGDENLRKCIDLGISKINVFSAIMKGGIDAIKGKTFDDYVDLKEAMNKGMAQILSHNILNFKND